MLTTEEIQQKKDVLAALELAWFKLDTGQVAVRVVIDGNETVFQKINIGNLLSHIASVKNDLEPYELVTGQSVHTAVIRNRRKFF